MIMMTRIMLHNLHLILSAEVVNLMVYLKNCLLNVSISEQTPYEVINKQIPLVNTFNLSDENVLYIYQRRRDLLATNLPHEPIEGIFVG